MPHTEIAKHAYMIIGLAVEVDNCINQPSPPQHYHHLCDEGSSHFFCLGLSENLSPKCTEHGEGGTISNVLRST